MKRTATKSALSDIDPSSVSGAVDNNTPGDTTPKKPTTHVRQSSPKKKVKAVVTTPQSDLEEIITTVDATDDVAGTEMATEAREETPGKGKADAGSGGGSGSSGSSITDPLTELFKTHDLIIGISEGATYPSGVFVTTLARAKGRPGESTAKMCMNGTKFETYSSFQETLQSEASTDDKAPVFFGARSLDDKDGLPTHASLVVSFIRDDAEGSSGGDNQDAEMYDTPRPMHPTRSPVYQPQYLHQQGGGGAGERNALVYASFGSGF